TARGSGDRDRRRAKALNLDKAPEVRGVFPSGVARSPELRSAATTPPSPPSCRAPRHSAVPGDCRIKLTPAHKVAFIIRSRSLPLVPCPWCHRIVQESFIGIIDRSAFSAFVDRWGRFGHDRAQPAAKR